MDKVLCYHYKQILILYLQNCHLLFSLQVLAKNARFEQIWRSRKGDKEAVENESLRGMYQFYDVIRVDDDEISSGEVQKQE